MKVEEEVDGIDAMVAEIDELTNESLNKVFSAKKAFMGFFQASYLVETLKKLVDKSKFVFFFNERSRKFLDHNRPIFKLTIPLTDELEKEFPSSYFEAFKKNASDSSFPISMYVNYKTSILMAEIISPFSSILYDKLEELVEVNRKIKEGNNVNIEDELDAEVYKKKDLEKFKEIFKYLPDDTNLTKMILVNMFRINLESTKGDLLYLEYLR
jgi:hypothetical protein